MPKLPNNTCQIVCPIDLDGLIMKDSCDAQMIEENLSINESILYDAIRTSLNSSWLLKLDVLSKFSKGFRKTILNQLDAFGVVNKTYFLNQVDSLNDGELKQELNEIQEDITDLSTQLSNPTTMLGNNIKEWDYKVLEQKITLYELIYEHISMFLKTKDKSLVDFSYSLFLPEILTPKFFNGLNEVGKLVIIKNISVYFQTLKKLTRVGLKTTFRKNEFNLPICLLKHIFSSDNPYSLRVKMLAWKEFQKIWKTISNPDKLLEENKLWEYLTEIVNKLKPVHKTIDDVKSYLDASDNVFESFELDCTLHNIHAEDFFLLILCQEDHWKMVDGLMDFQDEMTKYRLLNSLSNVLKNNLF